MKIPLSIVYKDADIIIVNKPAGLLSAEGRWDETEAHLDKILCEFLFEKKKTTSLYPVHLL